MLIESFEFNVPTHISFTLYRYNLIDSIIISRVLKDCRNYSLNHNLYKIKAEDFIFAIKSSPRLKLELDRMLNAVEFPGFKSNSIYFIGKIIKSLKNLDWISFNISYDKEYSRIVKYKDQELISFYYKIEEGLLDLSRLLSIEELDLFNMALINVGAISNNYLDRVSFFYIRAIDLLDLLTMQEFINLPSTVDKILNVIDPKFDEDNPLLLIKTDYTIY